MQIRPESTAGFSLFEVVIAVGIFAAAIAVMVGLLPSLTRQSITVLETQNALRLSDAVRAELIRLAAAGGLDSLATQANVLASPTPTTLELVALHDGAVVQSLGYQPPAVADRMAVESEYFLIELWRFADSPLAYEAGGPSLLLHARISWPYHLPNSPSVTPFASRERISFNIALRR